MHKYPLNIVTLRNFSVRFYSLQSGIILFLMGYLYIRKEFDIFAMAIALMLLFLMAFFVISTALNSEAYIEIDFEKQNLRLFKNEIRGEIPFKELRMIKEIEEFDKTLTYELYLYYKGSERQVSIREKMFLLDDFVQFQKDIRNVKHICSSPTIVQVD